MTDLIQIINWDKEKLAQEAQKIEDSKDISKLSVTKEEQKKFWLTVFLPSVIVVVFTVFAFIFADKIDGTYARLMTKILILVIGGFALAMQTIKIFSFESWAKYLLPPQADPRVDFHRCVIGKEITDVVSENYPFHTKTIVRPVELTLTDENGNESSYRFTENDWSFVATDKEYPIADLEDMIVFCPLAKIDEEDTGNVHE